MTTRWKITPEWQGQTVAVLASGPSMSPALAESLRHHKTIAVNYTFRLAPWADLLVALDSFEPFNTEASDFQQRRVIGCESPEIDALYAGQFTEFVRMSPTRVIEVRNSGLAAIRIVAAMGAAKIVLAGFDPLQHGHWYGDGAGQQTDGEPYTGLSAGLSALIAELQDKGISVERAKLAPAEDFAPIAPAKKKRILRV